MLHLATVGQSLASRITEICPEFRQTTLDEAAFRQLCRQSDRAFVCGDRVLCASQAAAKVALAECARW
jgi:hypothetical protein